MVVRLSLKSGVWGIRPITGEFASQLIATAEKVQLSGATFEGRTMHGTLNALWGAEILVQDVYNDARVVRGLGLGGVFDERFDEVLCLDYDGYLRKGNIPCSGASRVVASGDQIHAKGVRC